MSKVVQLPGALTDVEQVITGIRNSEVTCLLALGFTEGDALFVGSTQLKISDLLMLQHYLGQMVNEAVDHANGES
jgi:hypothetical protein